MKVRIGLVLLVLMSAPSWGLGKLGHETVCGIAQAQLQPAVQQQLHALARRAGYDSFPQSCNWADEIKREDRWEFTHAHHYVNFRRTAMTIDEPLRCELTGCILTAIDVYRQILLGQPLSSLERTLYKVDKDKALLFLAHLIGDLHQPLHVSFSEDHGGNRVSLRYRGESVNLHWLWDDVLLPPGRWQTFAARLNQQISPKQQRAWHRGSVTDWATESFVLTREIYRTLPANKRITETYVQRHRPLLEQRIQQAGVRLARMLNAVYAPPSQTLQE